PFVLYHWRASGGSVALDLGQKPFATERARDALRQHLARREIVASVEPSRSGSYHRVRRVHAAAPQVSLIIPTRDRVELLQAAVGSILDRTDYPSYEILVVDNQ